MLKSLPLSSSSSSPSLNVLILVFMFFYKKFHCTYPNATCLFINEKLCVLVGVSCMHTCTHSILQKVGIITYTYKSVCQSINTCFQAYKRHIPQTYKGQPHWRTRTHPTSIQRTHPTGVQWTHPIKHTRNTPHKHSPIAYLPPSHRCYMYMCTYMYRYCICTQISNTHTSHRMYVHVRDLEHIVGV